ncbi:cystatin-like [Clupea harengus]|uniref:Cystatin-like n=1 Tax=Clupea harengus TaxID=7950 RepID=A0A6P3WE84_CLUHA|nr:cystatin-like [Clupea harengus]
MTQSWRLLCAAALTLVAMSVAVPEGEIVDPQDPEVQACASFALESLSFRDKAHQYSIRRVISVSKAPIGGGQYDMDVEVKKIPCGPEGVDACTPGSANGQTLHCKFVVLTAPWKHQRVLLSSSCSDESQS